ncbi:MAG: hypothetical protein LBH49_00640 [Puniceicoccales bacterium]|jgi:hypothetical protein|nr:hypothetical protein [Puniceicoccales bacterium]
MANEFKIFTNKEDKNNTQISEARNLLALADKMFNDYCLDDDTIGKFFELEFAKSYKFDVLEAVKTERSRLEMMGLVPSNGWKKLPFEIDAQNDEKSHELLRRKAKEPEKEKVEIAINTEDKRTSLQQMDRVRYKLEESIESVKASELEVRNSINEGLNISFQLPSEQAADRPAISTCKESCDKAKISEFSRSDEYSDFSISEYAEKVEPKDDMQQISTHQVMKKVAEELEKAGIMQSKCDHDISEKKSENDRIDNVVKPKPSVNGSKTYRSSRSRGTVISALRSTVNRHYLDKNVKSTPENNKQIVNASELPVILSQHIEPENVKSNVDVSKKVKIRRRLKL